MDVLTIGDLVSRGDAEIQTGPFGTMLHASAYRQDGVPVVAVKNIADNALTDEDIPRVDEQTAKRLERYQLRVGDILFGRKGAVERRALVRQREQGWLQGSDCIRLRFKTSNILPEYVAYSFGTEGHRSWMLQNAQGATMPSLNQEIVARIPLRLPRISEQRRIVEILGALDDKIQLNWRTNETLEAVALALFADLLSSSSAVDFDEPRVASSPLGGRIERLDALAVITTGKRPGERNEHRTQQSQVPLWGGNGPTGYVTTPLFAIPILLTGRVGTLGVVFRINGPCWPSDNTFVIEPKLEIYSEFLYLHLRTRVDFHSLNRGSTQPLLAQTDLRAQQVLVPSQSTLNAFHSTTAPLFLMIDNNSNEIETLAGLRAEFLRSLFSDGTQTARRSIEEHALDK